MTDKNKCQCSCDECGAECEPFYKTNKTIIDGIDVSKCSNYDEQQFFQCEILKNATVTLAEGLNFQQERADKLEQECRELKEKQKELLHDCNSCKFHQYKQALDDIANYVRDNSDFDKSDKLTSDTGAYDILDIINKAKDGK